VTKMIDLQLITAATIARVSTASLGKFQPKLPKEKPIKQNVLTAKRKRANHALVTPSVEQSSQLKIIEGILSKKPKIDMEKAFNVHIPEHDDE
jgi:regulator of ribosome biosynthesis